MRNNSHGYAVCWSLHPCSQKLCLWKLGSRIGLALHSSVSKFRQYPHCRNEKQKGEEKKKKERWHICLGKAKTAISKILIFKKFHTSFLAEVTGVFITAILLLKWVLQLYGIFLKQSFHSGISFWDSIDALSSFWGVKFIRKALLSHWIDWCLSGLWTTLEVLTHKILMEKHWIETAKYKYTWN